MRSQEASGGRASRIARGERRPRRTSASKMLKRTKPTGAAFLATLASLAQVLLLLLHPRGAAGQAASPTSRLAAGPLQVGAGKQQIGGTGKWH